MVSIDVGQLVFDDRWTEYGGAMICPSCFGEMGEESHGGVQLDLCTRCPGAWFDGGELKAFQAGEGSPTIGSVPGPDLTFEPTGDSTGEKCPGCGHDILRRWTVGKRSVLRCTTCGGLFLPLIAPNNNPSLPDNVLAAAVRALEEIGPWLVGREKNGAE